ncbi:hypothetical protein RBH26_10260 [Natronolimnohabitans sp. A-GB9]|uniref:hypothetical protein n=1 Tax=Natronolimnohabitans sp. A-GB9 TaxID=3069757 RepID=UPI0027AF5CEB|nr:hypothetical protein [Natronolimnohabitans sp. A-GB9]MDQ2050866.1 hypothetical protein [Natronolimnohabitans sp. A-GB9]
MRISGSRRALLASVFPSSAVLAGCFENRFTGSDEAPDSGAVSTDDYDCDDVDRPEPSEQLLEEALEPAAYPEPPTPLSEDVGTFVHEFETAYRRNEFIEEYGAQTRSFEFRLEDRHAETIDSTSERDAVLASIVYTLSTATRHDEFPPERDTRVTYYVDENVVLRARYGGIANEPEFDPDPRDSGDPVACFE